MACSWNLHQRYFLKKMLFSMYISQFRNYFCWYKQKLKNGKVTSFFLIIKLSCERRSLFQNMIWSFLYIKSWSVNSGWLTLSVRSKVTRGDSFDFKMLLTIFSLQSKVFNKYIVDCKKIVKSSTLFLRTKVYYRHNWL